MHRPGCLQTDSNVLALPFQPSETADWDELVAKSPMGTFLHTRRFLSYHSHRFVDQSLMLYRGDRLVGVFPAELDPDEQSIVVSHPGATYGGIVHDGSLNGNRFVSALRAIINQYKITTKISKLIYKAIPYIYQSLPSNDHSYALFQLNARLCQVGVSAAVDLTKPLRLSRGRKSQRNAASRRSIRLEHDFSHISRYWKILETLLECKYQAAPVHSLHEITELHRLFPDKIELVTAWLGETIAGGIVLFHTDTVSRVQYLAANSDGHRANVLTPTLLNCIEGAKERGANFFDFGTSMQKNGKDLNANLYQFKCSFGAGCVTYESHLVELQNENK